MVQTKVALITGASRGIGAATARRAAGAGWSVAVNYHRDRAAAEDVAAACRGMGVDAEVFQADIGDPGAVAPLFAAVDARFGRLDALVNNAGGTGRASRLDAADPALVQEIIALNLTGTILCARAAIPRLSTRHGHAGGVIVNVSSMASHLGSPGDFVWYAASKGGVDSFTVGLGRELAGEGIRVCGVAPGLIETDIHALSSGMPDRLDRIAHTVPMGRAGTPDEVADVIVWLMSDAARYVTAETVRVSGGR